MVPSIADRAPYFWKVISLFSNEDNWHESFSREQKLYAKEHTINFQKKQDPEKKNRNKKKKMHNTSMLHTHKTRQPKKPQTHNRLIVLFNSHGKQRGKKNLKRTKLHGGLVPQARLPETCSTSACKLQNSETLEVFHCSERQSFKKLQDFN